MRQHKANQTTRLVGGVAELGLAPGHGHRVAEDAVVWVDVPCHDVSRGGGEYVVARHIQVLGPRDTLRVAQDNAEHLHAR